MPPDDRASRENAEGDEPGSRTEPSVAEWKRVDIPPHDIVRPPESDEQSAVDHWNPDYLGERMATAPSVAFESIPIPGDAVRVPDGRRAGGHTYRIAVLESEEDLAATVDLESLPDELPDRVPERIRERFEGLRKRYAAIDFTDSVLVFVASCCESSSIEHRWARVEATDAGLHLHGYYRQPELVTSDSTAIYSLLEVERPGAEIRGARASLTVDERTRVHFASADGPVTLIPGLVANDWEEAAKFEIRITSADGRERVNDEVSVDSESQWWRSLGLFGEYDKSYTVEVTVESLGIEASERYHADSVLGIWLTGDGELAIGPTSERDR